MPSKDAQVRVVCPDGCVFSETTRVEVDGRPLNGVRRVHLDSVGLDISGRYVAPGRLRRIVDGLRYAIGLR